MTLMAGTTDNYRSNVITRDPTVSADERRTTIDPYHNARAKYLRPCAKKWGGLFVCGEFIFQQLFMLFFANSHDVLCHYILHGSFLTNFKIRGGQNGVKCFPPCRCHGVMEVILIHVFECINWSNRFLVV
jgi:hypothetical protein